MVDMKLRVCDGLDLRIFNSKQGSLGFDVKFLFPVHQDNEDRVFVYSGFIAPCDKVSKDGLLTYEKGMSGKAHFRRRMVGVGQKIFSGQITECYGWVVEAMIGCMKDNKEISGRSFVCADRPAFMNPEEIFMGYYLPVYVRALEKQFAKELEAQKMLLESTSEFLFDKYTEAGRKRIAANSTAIAYHTAPEEILQKVRAINHPGQIGQDLIPLDFE